MAESIISQSKLRGLARNDDVELRVDRDKAPNKQLEHPEGSWGGRLIRWFKDVPTKALSEQYMDAKTEVRRALIDMYGEKIGTAVFRANIGTMRDGEHVSSNRHPITGRHIRQMIEAGDRLLLKKYSMAGHGGTEYGRLWSSPTGGPIPGVPEAATRDWMLRKSVGMQGPTQDDPPNLEPLERFDRRDMDMRTSEVKRGLVGKVMEAFDVEIEERPRASHGRGSSWTLDLVLVEGARLPSTHTIGLRIDPNDPDKVNVFDVNHCEVTVPRNEVAAWLTAHIDKNYALYQLQLFRAEEKTIDPRLMMDDGKLRARTEHTFENDKVVGTLIEKVEKSVKGTEAKQIGTLDVSDIFYRDLARQTAEVSTGSRSYLLDKDNFPAAMEALFADTGFNETEFRWAVFNLTALANQDGTTEPFNFVYRQLQKAHNADSVAMGEAEVVLQISLTNGKRPAVRIDVDQIRSVNCLGDLGRSGDYLEPGSYVHNSFALAVPLDKLGLPGGWEHVQMVEPLHMTGEFQFRLGYQVPSIGKGQSVGLHPLHDRLVSESLLNSRDLSRTLAGARDNRPVKELEGEWLSEEFVLALDESTLRLGQPNGTSVPLTPERWKDRDTLLGLADDGRRHLSDLLAKTTSLAVYDRLMEELRAKPRTETSEQPRLVTTVTPSLEGEKPCLDIEYRCLVPPSTIEDLPKTALVSRTPLDGGDIEIVVKVRIPVDDLNRGIPEVYDQMHAPRLEWTPLRQE